MIINGSSIDDLISYAQEEHLTDDQDRIIFSILIDNFRLMS